jgi:chemotaxis protein methyltransferase CheR
MHLAQQLASELPMHDDDFALIAKLMKQHAGINLGPHKRAMVYARLMQRVRQLGLFRFGDYCQLLTGPGGEAEIWHLVNALTTNYTRFFREPHHFDHLGREVLPAVIKKCAPGGPRMLRIWSAGCATGEEPYSIAITLRQYLPDVERWDARILATDISTDAVADAEVGVYGAGQVSELPDPLLATYFQKVEGDPPRYRISAQVSQLVTFNWLNLLGNWPMTVKFDAIFCRNVIIYFDSVTQDQVVRRLANALTDDGVLYLGHSESALWGRFGLQLVGRSIYRKAL